MSRYSRRAVLAATGGGLAALAGCSSLPWDEKSERTFDQEALAEIEALGLPAVSERVPVTISPVYLDDRRAAVREELDAVPAEIPAADIPNEVVREEVSRTRSRAAEALARAESAASPFERLSTLRFAHSRAVEARAGYRAVGDGLTMDTVLAKRPEVRADLRAFRDRRRVVGAPDDATIVLQATVEYYLGTVDRRLERTDEQSHAEGRVLRIAGAAQAMADARTYLADARYLYDRFRASRETRPVGAAFERASDALFADLRRRHDALPSESFTENPPEYLDVSGELDLPARRLLTEAFREAAWASDPEDAYWEGAASRLLAAHRADCTLRTFERVREAIENGKHDGPQDAGTVRAAKLDALGALERVRSVSAHPWLTNAAVRRVRSPLQRGDRYLEELSNGFHDPAEAVADAYAGYVRAGALARTIAPANAWVIGAVDAAAAEERTDG